MAKKNFSRISEDAAAMDARLEQTRSREEAAKKRARNIEQMRRLVGASDNGEAGGGAIHRKAGRPASGILKTRTTLFVEDGTLAALKEAAFKKKRTITDIINEALKEYLGKNL